MSDEIAEAIAETMEGYAQDETVKSSLANMKVQYEYVNREDSRKLVEATNDSFGEAAAALGY